MSTSLFHEYHFITDICIIEKLKDLTIYKEIKSLSGVVKKIFLLLIPVLRKEHKWGKQRMSRYMLVNEDLSLKRVHMHTYIPQDLYRQMKLIHQDLNFYSIAQLARGLIEFFLDLVEEYGDDVFKVLMNVFKQWEEEDEKTRLSLPEIIRQLSKIILHLPGKNGLINIYNDQFSPFWIFRL